MKTKRLFSYCILALVCLSFISVFSWNTSPIYGGQWEDIDSSVYKIVGKYWAEGLLPYVDLWDQKGPLIHAIDALGYLIVGNSNGIFIIQAVSLYITMIYIFKSLCLAFYEALSTFLCFFIVLSLSTDYNGGNLVEEFLLPFISVSYYILLKYLLNGYKDTTILFRFCFFVGLSLAFSFFTRLTNALGLCASEFILCLWILYDRKFKLFGKMILYTLLGCLVITIPVLFYFLYHDAFNEMWYATFTYNVEYAASMSNMPKSLGYFITSYLNCFLLTFVSLLLFLKKYYREGMLWITTALLPLAWFINGANFPHYGMIVFQYLTITFVLLGNYVRREHKDYILKPLYFISIGIMVFIAVGLRVYQSKNVFISDSGRNRDSYVKTACIKNHINKNSLLLYNFSGKEYLEEKVKPAVRFFFLQDFLIDHGPSIEQRVLTSLTVSKVEWIIAKGEVHNRMIKRFIDDHYKEVDKENGIVVYQLK